MIDYQRFRELFETATKGCQDLDDQAFDEFVVRLNEFLQDLCCGTIFFPNDEELYVSLRSMMIEFYFPHQKEELIEAFKKLYNETVANDVRAYPHANEHLLNWELSRICEKYEELGCTYSEIAEAGHIIEEAYR